MYQVLFVTYEFNFLLISYTLEHKCLDLGSSVGIILPPDADGDVYDLLENILHGIVSQTPPSFKEIPHDVREQPGLSDKISKGLVNGKFVISKYASNISTKC